MLLSTLNVQLQFLLTITIPVNYNSNTMLEDRLNGSALLKIHQDIEPGVQQVIDKFSADSRRIELI